ncbi:MAG: minor capsid protein [Burkholderiaceae bacterium]|jgi:SPP1 gp7 family putative phage head morphogenesis protein|nr:minor capsid protein [Burkholderiaceae bacterium]
MRENVDLAYCMTLPPREAIAYLRGKGYVISWDWEEVWQEAHARAFTVAKVTRLDILQDIREAAQKTLEEGRTAQWFEGTLTDVLKRKGWWGRTKMTDPHTGEIAPVQLGSPWRLETIYRTNTQTAYMAGRYARQMENADDRPYWQYVAIMDSRTRPTHRALNGQVFRHDDPFWLSYYPPNGWRCRCRVTTLSAHEVGRLGIKIETSAGKLGKTTRLVSQKTGELKEVATYRTTNPITREPVVVSPDVGWSYNPGMAWQPELSRYSGDLAGLAKGELRREVQDSTLRI